MRVDNLSVIITTKSKNSKCYQVSLSDKEIELIEDLLLQLHGGVIKVIEKELPLTIEQAPTPKGER